MSDSYPLFPPPRDFVPRQNKPVEGHRIVFGVDWGRLNEYLSVAIVDATAEQMVNIYYFKTDIGFAAQRYQIWLLNNIWKPTNMWAEANSIGSPNIEALQSEGMPVIPFHANHRSKTDLFVDLAISLEAGTIRLVRDEVLLQEMDATRLGISQFGKQKIEYQPGMSDHALVATALALYGSRYGSVAIRFA